MRKIMFGMTVVLSLMAALTPAQAFFFPLRQQQQATVKSPKHGGSWLRSTKAPPPRVRCGWYQRKLRGFDLDARFNIASNWAKLLPRSSMRAGAYSVKRGYRKNGTGGHVSKIVDASAGCARAVVHDNRGTYVRNICNEVYVSG